MKLVEVGEGETPPWRCLSTAFLGLKNRRLVGEICEIFDWQYLQVFTHIICFTRYIKLFVLTWRADCLFGYLQMYLCWRKRWLDCFKHRKVAWKID